MEKWIQQLLGFCKQQRNIYLYGAGLHAEMFMLLLENIGVNVEAFITTVKKVEEYYGLPVYSLEEAKRWLDDEDGVIPAFAQAEKDRLEELLLPSHPQVFLVEQKDIVAWADKSVYEKIFDTLNNQYSKARQWNPFMDVKEILVVRIDRMGDLICSIPFIRELKKNFPFARLSLVINQYNSPLVRGCPYVDRIILYPSGEYQGGVYEQCKNLDSIRNKVTDFVEREMKDIHYDVVFLPRDLLMGVSMIEELWLAFGSGADIRIAHCIDNGRNKQELLTAAADSFSLLAVESKVMHEVDYQLELLRTCQLSVQDRKLALWTEQDNFKKTEKTFMNMAVQQACIVCAVGIVGSLERKNWLPENYKKLFAYFQEKYGKKYVFLLLGGKDANNAAKHIEAADNVIDLTGKYELGETMAIINRCDMYLGSNTGLLHIASAYGKPAVVLNFSLNDDLELYSAGPMRWGAYGVDKCELIPISGWEGCHGVCQKNYSHCINLISVKETILAIEKISSRWELS